MSAEPYVLVGLVSGAAGFVVARVSAPLACRWPAEGAELAQRLTAVKLNARPSRLAKAMGQMLLTGLLLGGAMVAYAAEPSAPEQLPAEAVGVVGSGDQLSLRVWEGGQGRAVKVGEEYKDGWKLDGLTPSVATLSKGTERRQVGLNPSGAVPPPKPSASPSEVDVGISLSPESLASLQRLIDRGGWDGKTPDPGMTLEETRRYRAYSARGGEAIMAGLARSGGQPIQPTPADMYGALTPAQEADRLALNKLHNAGEYDAAVARGDVNQARIYDGLAVLGPDSFYVPAGKSLEEAARDAGLMHASGYSLGDLDATGGRTMTKAPASGRPLQR